MGVSGGWAITLTQEGLRRQRRQGMKQQEERRAGPNGIESGMGKGADVAPARVPV